MDTTQQQTQQPQPMGTQQAQPAGQADAAPFQERTLIISGLSATFVKDKDLIGAQDPYLTLTLSGDKVTTQVVKAGGINPVWPVEEGYCLHDRGEHPELLVHAWNKNTLLKDSSLGEGKIAMAELGPAGNEHIVPLFDKKGAQAGELKFRAHEENETGATSGQHGVGAGTATGVGAGAAGPAGREQDSARDGKTAHHHKEHKEHKDKHPKDHSKAEKTKTGRDDHAYAAQDTTRAGQTTGLQQGQQYGQQQQGFAGQQQQPGQFADATQGQQYAGQQQQGGGLSGGQAAGLAAGAAGAGGLAGAAFANRDHRQGETGDATRSGQTGDLRKGGIAGTTSTDTTDTSSDNFTDQTGNLHTGTAAQQGSGSSGAGLAAGAGAGLVGTTTKRTTESTDRNVNESSEYHKTGGGVALDLPSSDDHWQRSLEAAAAARKQAQIVEEQSRVTHEKLLAAQAATRAFEQARREHMAVQDKLAALDLESKRTAFHRSTEAYEQAQARLASQAADADAAAQEANALRAVVNEKGEALDKEVSATKLHQGRLAELEAELGRVGAAHDAAHRAHQDAFGQLEPLRARHTKQQDELAAAQRELEAQRTKRAQLEAQERELEALLQTHNAEYETTGTDLAELEEMGRKKAADAEARRGDLSGSEREVAQVQAELAEHRNRIGLLKQETEAQLAHAGQLSDTAARAETDLLQSQQAAGDKEVAAAAAQKALDAAQAQQAPLQEKIRKETHVVDSKKDIVEELHRKLGTARSEVDKAQARKEELWEKAKWHGEQADKVSDTHFLHAHHDHKTLTGHESVDPQKLTGAGPETKSLLEKAGEKIGL